MCTLNKLNNNNELICKSLNNFHLKNTPQTTLKNQFDGNYFCAQLRDHLILLYSQLSYKFAQCSGTIKLYVNNIKIEKIAK